MHFLVIHSNDWQTNMLIQWFVMQHEHKITRWRTEDPELSFDSLDGAIIDFDTETIMATMSAIGQLRTTFPNLPIILFSDLDRNGDSVRHAFAIGATNYVPKQGLAIVDARNRVLEFIGRR